MDPWERFSDLFDEMKPYVREGDWQGLELHYANMASRMSGPEPARAVGEPSLDGYEKALKEALMSALRRLVEIGGTALYFEYDIDNDWQSWFFLYDQYVPESVGDDEWAVSWKLDIEGPAFPVFTELYETYGGFNVENDPEIGITLYLVARTTAAFGRVCDGLSLPNIAVCVGYHDQGDLTRIREAPGS
jgi:hypothetical protein